MKEESLKVLLECVIEALKSQGFTDFAADIQVKLDAIMAGKLVKA